MVLIGAGFYFSYQKTILSFDQIPWPAEIVAEEKVLAQPVAIEVESQGIKLPVEEGKIVDGIWEISPTSASHLDISAHPGQEGNIVIYGHNKKAIFGPLLRIKVGEVIKVRTSDGQVHQYLVESTQTVKPSQIEVVQPTDYEILTVYTCTGILDSERFVIKARPWESLP